MVREEFNEEGLVSEWNEALFKMKRLHQVQTEINIAKMNPLGKNRAIGRWNFEIWFSLVCSLFEEGYSKYKQEEIEEIDNLKKTIEDLLETKHPYEVVNSAKYGGKFVKNNKLIKENWLLLKKIIEIMERKVKIYNDQHGLSTKNKENKDGRSILR